MNWTSNDTYVFRFVEGQLPGRSEWTRGIFRARGAYRRFKDMLEREGMIDQWHAFENQAMIEAFREWCAGEAPGPE